MYVYVRIIYISADPCLQGERAQRRLAKANNIEQTHTHTPTFVYGILSPRCLSRKNLPPHTSHLCACAENEKPWPTPPWRLAYAILANEKPWPTPPWRLAYAILATEHFSQVCSTHAEPNPNSLTKSELTDKSPFFYRFWTQRLTLKITPTQVEKRCHWARQAMLLPRSGGSLFGKAFGSEVVVLPVVTPKRNGRCQRCSSKGIGGANWAPQLQNLLFL